jgi:hypothetical protein
MSISGKKPFILPPKKRFRKKKGIFLRIENIFPDFDQKEGSISVKFHLKGICNDIFCLGNFGH